MYDNYSLGKRIAKYRTALKISQERLAELSDLSTEYIGQLERGTKNPTVKVMYKICAALGMSLSDFFDEKQISESDALTNQIMNIINTRTAKEKERLLTMLRLFTECIDENKAEK